MIKQVYITRVLPVLLRGGPRLLELHTRVATPHVRYFNTKNTDNNGKSSGKSHMLEIDLLASSLGLIVTLTAIYFISPKIETKRPRQKVKSNNEPVFQPKTILPEKTNSPSTNNQATIQTDDTDFNNIQSHNEQLDNKIASDATDKPQEKYREKDHIELVEMVVPGDVNILKPYRASDEGGKAEIKDKEPNKIPTEQKVGGHDLEEGLFYNKKDCKNVSLKQKINADVDIPSSEVESQFKDEVLVAGSPPFISDLNKDKSPKNEADKIVNNFSDDNDSKEMVKVDFDKEKDISPSNRKFSVQEPHKTGIKECASNIGDRACQEDDITEVGIDSKDSGEMSILSVNTIAKDNVCNESQNELSPSLLRIDVDSMVLDQPSRSREDCSKNLEPVTRLDITGEKQMTEFVDRDNIPLKDVRPSLTIHQKKNIIPHKETDSSIVIDDYVEDLKETSNLEITNESKEEKSTQLNDIGDFPYQDTPLSLTEDQKKYILPSNSRKALSKSIQDNNVPSPSDSNEVFSQIEDDKVDVVFKQDKLNEADTEVPDMIETVARKKPISTDINKDRTLDKQVQNIEERVVGETIAVKQKPVDEVERAYDPDTGEINWDCPCLGGLAQGPCGEEFKLAFSCFVYSEKEPKGSECISKFQGMQSCFQKHPDYYINDNDAKRNIEEDDIIS